MKKKIDIRIVIIIILTIVFIILACIYFKPTFLTSITQNEVETDDSTTATAEVKTILNTISKTGEIKSNIEENLELHASYYFEEIYVQKNQYVEKDSNILKYTNGTYLKAPYNCVITVISIPVEGSICTTKNYITIKGTDTLLTTLSVSEDELSEVYVGQEAQIIVSSLEKTYTGYVTNVSNTATYSSNGSSFSVTVEFNNDGDTLIGMTGKTAVILDKAENVIAVPTEAVETTNGTSYVTIINSDGKSVKTKVETGITNDAYTEIKSGVNEGETVEVKNSDSTTSTNAR